MASDNDIGMRLALLSATIEDARNAAIRLRRAEDLTGEEGNAVRHAAVLLAEAVDHIDEALQKRRSPAAGGST